jgi:uncharacterized protein (TIGR02246 family)
VETGKKPDVIRITEREVKAFLVHHVRTWNSGDLSRVLTFYADDASFMAGMNYVRGTEAIRRLYEMIYPTCERMGVLGIDTLQISIPAPTLAVVMFKWRIVHARDRTNGSGMIVIAKRNDGLRITHDASSISLP